mmetsp:Transcript_23245/g.34600  ORF Transcript_23245/g.34600 Transcript_23245/m.34600 type:complete len:406 (+) Transcript_23245:49-1266(+)
MVTVEAAPTSPGRNVPYTSLAGTFIRNGSSSSKATIFFMVCVALTTFFNLFYSPRGFGNGNQVQAPLASLMRDSRSSPLYIPAAVESYVTENAQTLGYAHSDPKFAEACAIWRSPAASTLENYQNLMAFREEVENFSKIIENFDAEIPPLMDEMRQTGGKNWANTCKALRPHPDGIEALFPSQQISKLPFNNGYVEPLLPPMRHPAFCDDVEETHIVRLDYMVHDFEAMCLSLKPHSRIVLFDLGASLKFHRGPIVQMMKMYEKFGFMFDHIYAFELTPFDPIEVYETLIPEEYFSAYHWINAGVSGDPNNRMNPLKSILKQFNQDDLIIFKLDIDTSSIEVPLAYQLLKDEATKGLVDHFYFEHHVNIKEMERWWGNSMQGSMKDSLELMGGLREKGVGAHYWI